MADATPAVRHLRDEHVREWLVRQKLNERPMRVFRYKANRPGLWSLGIIGLGTLVAVGAYVARGQGVSTAQGVVLGLVVVFALVCLLTVLRWGVFTVVRYLVLTDDELLIGAGRRATVIDASRLSRSTIRANEMRQGARIGLPIEIDGYSTRVHLVGAFALLNDLNQFIAEVLARVARNDGITLDDDSDDAEAADEADSDTGGQTPAGRSTPTGNAGARP